MTRDGCLQLCKWVYNKKQNIGVALEKRLSVLNSGHTCNMDTQKVVSIVSDI
jgi:hypothetical protein